MSQTHDQRFDGFAVAYIPRDWLPRERLPKRYRAPLRELGSRARDAELVLPGLRVVAAACVCGWRSPLCIGLGPAHWECSAVHVSPRADAALAALWREHALEPASCIPQNRARASKNRAPRTQL